jgi:hypothetical protein
MRNCIILGSGRSGTSMVAGALAAGGYFMGEQLYPPRDSNPKGFFEGPQINGINEALLEPVVPPEQGLRYGQRWLAQLDSWRDIRLTGELERAIRVMVEREPYCFKDPRFSYTLPVWQPYLRSAVLLCVFREPGITAESIVKECAEVAYLSTVRMTLERALDIWTAIYRSVLSLPMEVAFVHYSQILGGDGLSRIARLLGAPVDASFPDMRLRRSRSNVPVPAPAASLYEELCRRAGYASHAAVGAS